MSGLSWRPNTSTDPTMTVVSIPPAQNQPRIRAGCVVLSAITTTTSSSGHSIDAAASRKISSSGKAARSADASLKAPHAPDPAVVVRGFAAHELEHLGVGQDQEALLIDRFQHDVGDVL